MRKVFKWLFGISVLLLVGVICFGAVAYGILLRTLPNDDGEMNLAGLSAPVEVVFDQHAVPHIEAESMEDAMQTLGFIHARERLWQMIFLRGVGEGRLSEIVGDATVDTDVFLRTLDMAGAARKSYEKLQPRTKQALIAYTKGVNAFAGRETRMFEPKLGAEFLILSHEPEKWEPWNSVLLLKIMGFSLGSNLDREIQRLAMASKGFNPQEIDDLVSYSPRDNPPPLPDLRDLYGFGKEGKLKESASLELDETPFNFDWRTGETASNNWVISGSRTTSGKPILANDPHLGFTAPSTIYLAHLSFQHEGERRDIIGGTIPGIPMIITGRNNKVGWGLTTTGLDSQDLFIEKISPTDDNLYKTITGWENFQTEEIEIKVKDGKSKFFTKRSTRHGPVLPDGFRDLKKILPERHVGALQWLGLAEDDTTLDTLFHSMLAKNVSDMLEGVQYAVSPMQSLVVADVEGNIGLATPAKVPMRDKANLLAGRAPALGWRAEHQWKGFVKADDLPKVINPDAGAIATANAKFFKQDYPHHITFDWAEHFRQARVEGLVLGQNEKHTVEQSQLIMADDFSQPLFELVKIAAAAELDGAGEQGDIFNALNKWDGRMAADKPEPLIMLAWFKNLHEAILQDDLGDQYKLFDRGRITRILRILELGTARDWCDNRDTEAKESCALILSQTFDETLKELKTQYGSDWQNWEYGKAHIAFGEHKPFGKVSPLSKVFNVNVESGGGPYTLHRGQMDFGEEGPYRNRHGAAYRAVYDFNDLNNSIYIQSAGQSGNFLSQHYRDFAKPWSQSKFISMTTKKESYALNAKGTWMFTPE
jgi:penicillin amidase